MFKQGDILLIPFPYSDMTATKQRPVIVLSNSYYNESHQDIVVAAITSNVTQKEYLVRITDNDLEEGQLKLDSVIRADKVYTFSKRIVNKKFGHIKAAKLEEVKKQLVHLFNDD
jgi:mRNA interferase MazF